MAERLSAAQHQGLTRKELAAELGVTPDAVAHWERRIGVRLIDGRTRAKDRRRESWSELLRDASGRQLTRPELAKEQQVEPRVVARWEQVCGVQLLSYRERWHMLLTQAASQATPREQVAQDQGVTVGAVGHWERKLGIRLDSAAEQLSAQQWKLWSSRLNDAQRQGLTRAELARSLNLLSYSIGYWERTLGITLITLPQRWKSWLDEASMQQKARERVAVERGVDVDVVRHWEQRCDVRLPREGPQRAQRRNEVWRGRLLTARAEGRTRAEVAAEVGVTARTVRYWEQRCEVPLAARAAKTCGLQLVRLAERWHAWLTDAHDQDLTREQVAAARDVPPDRVAYWERRHDVRLLTDAAVRRSANRDQWQRILDAASTDGLRRSEVARQQAVAPGTVASWERHFGVELRRRGPLTPQAPNAVRQPRSAERRQNWALELAKASQRGQTREQVAAGQSVTTTTVAAWEHKTGIRLPTRAQQQQQQRRDRFRKAITAGRDAQQTVAEVAASLAVRPQAVYTEAKRLGVRLAPGRSPRAKRPDPTQLQVLLDEHATVAAVAKHLNVAASSVYRWCHQDGVATPGRQRQAGTDWDDPARLASALAAGLCVRDIAQQAQVPSRIVSRWLSDYGLGQPRTPLGWAAQAIADRHDGDDASGVHPVAYRALPPRVRRRLDVARVWLDREGITLDDASVSQLQCWVLAAHGHGAAATSIIETCQAVDAYDASVNRPQPRGLAMREKLDATHRRWGSNPTPRRTVAVPYVVLQRLWAVQPEEVAAAVRHRGDPDLYLLRVRALRLWLALTFANGCRAQTPAGMTLGSLMKPAPTTVWSKHNIESVAAGHTPSHLLCPRCELEALLDEAPDVRLDTELRQLVPSADLIRKHWHEAAGLPPCAVTLGSARVTVATILWQRTSDVVAVGRALGHRDPGGPVTVRYIQTLPQMAGLDDDDCDVDGWTDYAVYQHEARAGGRRRAGSIPSMRLDDAMRSELLNGDHQPGGSVSPNAPAALWWWSAFHSGQLGVVDVEARDPHDPETMLAWAVCLHRYFDLRPKTVQSYAAAVAAHLLPRDATARRRLLEQALDYLRAQSRIELHERAPVQAALLAEAVVSRWVEVCLDNERDDLARLLSWGWGTSARPSSLYALTPADIAPAVDGVYPVSIRHGTKRRRKEDYSYLVPVSTAGPVPLLAPDVGASQSVVDGVHVITNGSGPLRPGREFPFQTDWRALLQLVAETTGEDLPHGTSPMSLRHSSLTALWLATRDLLLTQRKAGHGSPVTTLTYLSRISTQVRSQAAFGMAEVLAGAWTTELEEARRKLTEQGAALPPQLWLPR